MRWFSRKIPDSEKEGALALVRHLQGMLAYQQLAMETYNDALASVGGDPPPGAELLGGAYVPISDSVLVAEYVIPALKKKIEILRLMEAQHNKASALATGRFAQPCQEMTSAICAMLDRAAWQHHGFTKWVQKPQMPVDVTRFDRLEREAKDRAVNALNGLIKRIGLTHDEWIGINRDAFNSVRASVGLTPLDGDVFCTMYFRGLTGERVRFFTN